MASFVLKPMIPNLYLMPNLTAVSVFTRNRILINQSGIFWSAPVRYQPRGPSLPPEEEEAICMIKFTPSLPP